MSASRSASRNSSGRQIRAFGSAPSPGPGARARPSRRRRDPVLGRESSRLIVELADRHARIEHLDRVHLVEHIQQMLVVRDRVQPVERVGHIDQPALALDVGDRLPESHPAGDLLLDEQPDHLALIGRLASSPTITSIPSARARAASALRRSRRAVTAIAPSPRARASASNTSTGVGQPERSGRRACAGRRRPCARRRRWRNRRPGDVLAAATSWCRRSLSPPANRGQPNCGPSCLRVSAPGWSAAPQRAGQDVA